MFLKQKKKKTFRKKVMKIAQKRSRKGKSSKLSKLSKRRRLGKKLYPLFWVRKIFDRFKKKKKKSTAKKRVRQRRKENVTQGVKQVIRFSLVIIGIISLGVVILLNSKKLIFQIRDLEETTITNEKVIGFPNVVQYPDSEYVFENHADNEIVQELLQNGFSVYRLPPNHSIDDVYLFYQDALPKLGWKKVLEVPVDTADKRSGWYWVRNGEGLRIYTEIYDIWYQRVTEIEAHNGLANVVEMENTRKLILAEANRVELLPDFPWRLELSGQYNMRYNVVADFGSNNNNNNASDNIDNDHSKVVFREVLFQRIDQNGIITLFPINTYTGGTLDSYLDEFVQEYGLEVQNAVQVYTPVGTCIEADLQLRDFGNVVGTNGNENDESESAEKTNKDNTKDLTESEKERFNRLRLSRKALLMHNTGNHVVYALLLPDGASDEIVELYEFIKENIEIVE